jgi:hypothetical protein
MLPERRREPSIWLPAILSVVVSIAMTWPIVLHLGSEITRDIYDPLFDTWQVAWIGHAVVHQPLHLFQGNRFYPEHDSLAFNDVMLGYAPAGIVAAQGTQAALVVHNLLVIFVYALAFLGAYLLARELGAGQLGAIAAGAAFSYAPWRLPETGHLQVVSSGGIPLALFLFLRGYRRKSGWTIFGGWLVTAWQMTLGFTYGIPFTYFLGVLAVIAAVIWWQRGMPSVPNSVVAGTAAGVCVFALVAALQVRPYLRVVHDHPESKRTVEQVSFFSPPPRAWLVAPGESWLWAGPTAHRRSTLHEAVEENMFPGVAVLVLALLGLASAAYTPTARLGIATGVVAWGVLSLGIPGYPHPTGFTPYRLMYDIAPGWDGMRTPGRLNTFTSLGLALLAGAGLTLVTRQLARRRGLGRTVPALAGCAVVGVILLEGFGPIPHPVAPTIPKAQIGLPAPQLHLPTDDVFDQRYSWWSVDGFPKMANGGGSFDPTSLLLMRQTVTSFPDAASVAFLRRIGIRTVVLHPDLAFGTAWQDAASRPTAGLPLTREERGGLVVYHLSS